MTVAEGFRPSGVLRFGVFVHGVNPDVVWRFAGGGLAGRVRDLPARRPARRARRVCLLLPRRGAAPQGEQRRDLRAGCRGPPRRAEPARGARRGDLPHRARRHAECHVQRRRRPRAPAAEPRPRLRRAGRLERRYHHRPVDRGELQARRLPAVSRPLRQRRRRARRGARLVAGTAHDDYERLPPRLPRPGAAEEPAGRAGGLPGWRLPAGPRLRRPPRGGDLLALLEA